jgi:biopolymer transport protein ExbD
MTRLALVLLVACGKHDDPAPRAGAGLQSPAPAPEAVPTAPAEAIALPLATGDPVGTATTYLRFTGGALVEIDRGSVFGDRTKPFSALDERGTLTAPAGRFTPAGPHDPFPVASPTAVFADRAELAAPLRAATGTVLRDHCWGFAVADHGKLELLEPTPCPPAARHNDQVNLDLVVTTAGTATAKLSTETERTALASPDALQAFLVQQKATPTFAGRTDLAISFDAQATVATVVDALARAHAAGFASAAWAAQRPPDDVTR